MKLVEQKAELLLQQDWKKQIELAARTCYKSEDKIAEGTAEKMVEMLIKRKHYAMLEHGTIYLHCHSVSMVTLKIYDKYYFNPYSRAKISADRNDVYVTTNYRVIKEHGWEKDLVYMCQPTDCHVKRYTYRLTTSIGVVRELLRHRVFSFANESTRYCNYSKDKFDNGITCIMPSWFLDKNIQEAVAEYFMDACKDAENYYFSLLKCGYSPQQAREVLPLSTKSELIMTGFEDDWGDFFFIRLLGATGKPHPDMEALADMMHEELIEVTVPQEDREIAKKVGDIRNLNK